MNKNNKQNEAKRRWKLNNPEYDKQYYLKNKDKIKEKSKKWSLKNKEKRRKIMAKYNKNNVDKRRATCAKRRASKLNRTPKWLTNEHLKQIKDIFNLAKELQWLSDEKLSIDHIVPLQGENVSGLHVPWNLQILPRSKNTSKGNKFK